ncbi:MAG: GAF domain-containing protein [Anaerolinea sp.]|nr:GAF domain-containing protein [Anaerolinea sp.]
MAASSPNDEQRRIEEQLRSLISSLDDFVFSIDLDGRFLFYQPIQWSIYDTPAVGDVYLRARYHDVLPEEIASVLPDVTEQIHQTLSPQPISYQLTLEGKPHYFKGRVAPMFSARFQLIGYTFVASDVTEAVLAQQREERLLRLDALRRTVEGTFFTADRADEAINTVLATLGTTLDVGRTYVFHFRENERLLDNTHEWCAPGIAPEIHNLQGMAFDEVVPSFLPLLTGDGIINAPDIRKLPVDVSEVLAAQAIMSVLIVPLHVNDRLDGFIGLDETRYHRDWLPEEIAALQVAASAYGRVLERQRAQLDLIQARDAAVQSSQHKGEFVAKMSHEFRTPMTALLGMIELLDETPLDTHQQELLMVAHNNAKRLLGILTDVLDFAELEKGEIALQALPIDIRGLVAEVAGAWARPAADKGLAFATHVDQQVPERVVGDAARIRQVLTQLMQNAVKFTERGEIRLSIRQVSALHGKARLRFEVSDTGIGVPADKQETIFESFVQADNSMTRRYGGSGLGLAICRQLVLLMEGEIDVHSQEGTGSTFGFTVTFPTTP